MHRFRRLDATTTTIGAQLFADERVLEERDGIGLYDG
jgi:ESCRT-II complex subunit VPS36